MLIDDYEDEKQDVAIITPAESPEEAEPEPAADDCGCGQHIHGRTTLTLARR